MGESLRFGPDEEDEDRADDEESSSAQRSDLNFHGQSDLCRDGEETIQVSLWRQH